jgi:hypothetical protein
MNLKRGESQVDCLFLSPPKKDESCAYIDDLEAAKFPRIAKNVAKEFFVDSISRVAATIRPGQSQMN